MPESPEPNRTNAQGRREKPQWADRARALWYELLRLVLFLGGVALYGLRISGRENVPRDGGVLVLSNHQSHFDPPLIGLCCPRQMNFLARKTLFDFRPFALLISSLNAFPIDRDGNAMGGVKETLRRLKRGEMVLMFPEGTRTSDGEIAPFRPGFLTLAKRSGAWVLPVAMEGPFSIWPRHRRLPRLWGTIHVRFAEPIPPEVVAQADEAMLKAEAERRLRACHAELRSHPAFRGTVAWGR